MRMPVRHRPPAATPPESDGHFDVPEWLRTLGCALGAAFVSAAIVVSAVCAAWLASVASTVPASHAVAAGVQAWLFTHGATPDFGSGRLGLIPWLATLLPLSCLRWSAQRLVAERAERPVARRADIWIRPDVAAVGAGFAATYAVVTFLAAALAGLPSSTVNPLLAGAAGFLLASLGYGLACLDCFRGRLDRLCPRLLRAWPQVVPPWLRTAIRPAWRGVLTLGALGLLAVIGVLAINISRVASLYADLGPGWIGGFVLTLGQLLYLPTAAAWAVAFAAGPGFSVGSGTAVTIRGSEGGALPLVPMFGALPDPGPISYWALLVLLVPVCVGISVGWMAVRSLPRLTSWKRRAAAVAASCGSTGLAWTLLFVLCSGPLGDDRLRHVGVAALPAGAALTAELLLGGLLALAASGLRVRRIARGRPAADARGGRQE